MSSVFHEELPKPSLIGLAINLMPKTHSVISSIDLKADLFLWILTDQNIFTIDACGRRCPMSSYLVLGPTEHQ